MTQFTTQDAVRLMSKMKAFYGKKYAEQWGDITAVEIAEAMVECLQSLSTDDFKRGYKRMQKSTFCPTIPEFRSWCEPQASDWLDAHEAWAIAKNSVEFGTGRELTVIWTEQAAKAFDKCADLVATGDKYQMAEAKKIFIAIYERLVAEAKDQGISPVYITSLGTDKNQQIAAINQAVVNGHLPMAEAQFQLEHKRTTEEEQAEADTCKTTAQKALAKLSEGLKRTPMNKMAQEHKEPQAWESVEISHVDPFDQSELYKANLKQEGRPVPAALKSWESKLGQMVAERRAKLGLSVGSAA